MSHPIHASCLCGSIQIHLLALPKHYYMCHCSLCRKQGGAASNAATIVQSHHLIWVKGAELVSHYQRPTGFTSDFCRTCGSPMPNPVGEDGLHWFPLGLLDDPVQISLHMHLFTESGANWAAASKNGICFKTMPSIREVLELLRR